MKVLTFLLMLSVFLCNTNNVNCRIHHFRSTLHSTPRLIKPKTPTNFTLTDFHNFTKTDSLSRTCNFKIASWNVNGLRIVVKRDYFEYIRRENPDILLVQKLMCLEEQIPKEAANIDGYHFYSYTNDTQAIGVALYSKAEALAIFKGVNHPKRYRYASVLTAEYEHFFVVTAAALPPSGKILNLIRRLFWDSEFLYLIKQLDAVKPVVIGGSLLVTNTDLDVHHYQRNRKRTPTLHIEEKLSFRRILQQGFNDTFRLLYPKAEAIYTYWSATRTNEGRAYGKRVDFFLVSNRLAPFVCDSIIRTKVYGSQHYPIVLCLHVPKLKQ